MEKERILVDDCSTDGTRELIESELRADHCLVKIYHQVNLVKGVALRSGFEVAVGDIVLVQNADLKNDPVEYPKLLKPILDGKADVVFGFRFVGSAAHRVRYFWHMVGNKVSTLFSNMFKKLYLADGVLLNSYDLSKKERLIARLKCRICEVGISYSGRT